MIGPPKYASGPPPPPPKTRPMTLPAAALWVTGITLVFLMLGTAAISLRQTASRDVFVQFGCQVAAYSLGLFGLLRVYGPETPIRKFIALRRTHPAFYPVALALGAALAFPANLLFELAHRLFPQLDAPTDISTMFFEAGPSGRLSIAVAVLVAGPFVEEVVFRGALFGPLLQAHRTASVVAGTAAYFALVHLDPHAMAPIVLVGLLLGYVRAASGSLWPAVLLHVGFNAVPLVGMLSGERPAPPGTTSEIPVVATVLATIACVVLVVAVRRVSQLDAARVARSLDAQS